MSRGHHRHGHSLLDREISVEEIQFLAPQMDLFAGHPELHDITPPDEAVEAFADVDATEARRSRWTTVAAAAGLAGCIAVGVIVAAPWRDDEVAVPPATTPPPPSTIAGVTPLPAQSPAQLPAPHNQPSAGTLAPAEAAETLDAFLIDPTAMPTQLTPMPAMMPPAATPEADGAAAPVGWLELWATRDASRMRGTWFSIGWTPKRDLLSLGNAARIPVGDDMGLLRMDDDGVGTLVFERSGGTTTIGWFGRTDAEMVAFAADLSFDAHGGVVYPSDWVSGDLVRLLAGPSAGADLLTDFLGTGVGSAATYRLTDGRFIAITTMKADLHHLTIRPFVMTPVPDDPMSGPSVYRVIGDRTVVIGRIAADDSLGGHRANLLEWTQGHATVQLIGDLASSQLLALVPIIRRGTAGEWWTMSSISPDVYDSGFDDADSSSASAPDSMLGFGELPDGAEWFASFDPIEHVVDVSATGSANAADSADDSADTYFSIDLDNGPCGTSSNASSTIVVCVRLRPTGVETMHIEGKWGSRDVNLTPYVDGSPSAIGVAQFTVPGAFRVDLIGPDGTSTNALSVGPVSAT